MDIRSWILVFVQIHLRIVVVEVRVDTVLLALVVEVTSVVQEEVVCIALVAVYSRNPPELVVGSEWPSGEQPTAPQPLSFIPATP